MKRIIHPLIFAFGGRGLCPRIFFAAGPENSKKALTSAG